MPDQDLLATCWTTAGDAAPLRGDERSPLPLRERVESRRPRPGSAIGPLHIDLVVAEREHGLAGDPVAARRQRSRPPGAGAPHPLVGRRATTAAVRRGPQEAPGGRQRSAHATSRSRSTSAANPGPRPVGGEFAVLAEDACWWPGPGSGWSSFPGRTSGRSMTACGCGGGRPRRRRPHHRHVAHRAGRTPPAELAAVPLRHIVGVELSDADGPGGHSCSRTLPTVGVCVEGVPSTSRVRNRAPAPAVGAGPWGSRSSPRRSAALVREAVAAAFATAEAQLELADDGR